MVTKGLRDPGRECISIRMTPGQKLARWRKKADLTQAGAAELVGVSQPAWSGWETDASEPGIALAFKIEEITKGAVKARDFAERAA